MACLKNNGVELARLVKSLPLTPNDGHLIFRKVFMSLRSNGWVLRKSQVRYMATSFKEAYNHDWGWQRWIRVKQGVDIVEALPRIVAQYKLKGFTEV